jgi:hypothetical protein
MFMFLSLMVVLADVKRFDGLKKDVEVDAVTVISAALAIADPSISPFGS